VPSRFRNAEAAARSGEIVTFSFGENWQHYLSTLTPDSEADAIGSLREAFDAAPLDGCSFVDVGCGSGLFSLAALRVGARRVVSIDVDPNSLDCVATLRSREGSPNQWEINAGSVLDRQFLRSLGKYERVYSWGVLHHTGALREAIINTLELVAPGGWAVIALYNRPPRPEFHFWLKRTYNRLPRAARPLAIGTYGAARLVQHALRGGDPRRLLADYGAKARGMTYWRDIEDWLGGLPYEYIEEEEFRAVVEPRGFELIAATIGSPGANNEYVLRRAT
jgi:SAM-dependent methyltransferase